MCEVPSSIHFESFPYSQTGAGEALGIIFGDGGGDGDGDGVGDTDGGETGAGVGEGALGWLLVSVLSSLHHEAIVFWLLVLLCGTRNERGKREVEKNREITKLNFSFCFSLLISNGGY